MHVNQQPIICLPGVCLQMAGILLQGHPCHLGLQTADSYP
jgi:hypothetical protein